MRYINRTTATAAGLLLAAGLVTGYQKRHDIGAFFARHMPVASGELDRRVAAEINSNNEAKKKVYEADIAERLKIAKEDYEAELTKAKTAYVVRVGELEGRLTNTTTDLDNLKSDSERRIEDLLKQLDKTPTQEAYNDLTKKIDERIGDLTRRIDAIPSAANLPDYKTALEELRRTVDALGQQYKTLDNNYTGQQAQIAEIYKKLGEAKKKESAFKAAYGWAIKLLTTKPTIKIVSIRDAPGGVQAP